MDFRVLGPIDVSEAGSVVDVGGSKPRALLAMLLLNRGGTLSRARLIEGLWDNDPPASAAKLIQVNISNLRKAIGADRIRTDGDGYALDVMPEDWSDIAAFESLVRDVQDEDPATTADRLRAASSISARRSGDDHSPSM